MVKKNYEINYMQRMNSDTDYRYKTTLNNKASHPALLNGFLLLVMIALLNGCENDKCMHSTGEIIIKRIETGYFYQVDVWNLFDIILVQDTTYYVELEGGENVLKHIIVENNDSLLFLDDENKCFWLRDYGQVNIYIHFSDLRSLNIQEVSYITSANPITDNFMIGIQARLAEMDLEIDAPSMGIYTNKTSSGRYKFKGRCNRLYVYSTYSSIVEADSLICREAEVHNHSIGSTSVYATESLQVEISNSGNVYYRGNPEIISSEITSDGQLIHLED